MRRMMERQVEHMVRLIDDLLDVSRITRGKIKLQKKPTTVAELLDVAIEANRAVIEERGITLSVRVSAPTTQLDVDATRIVQVLSNLLHNARKFTPHGGRIEIAARTQGNILVLSVRDSGIGISAEAMPRIFDLFTQGDRSDAQVQGGLGIGLALARRLVEMHGGHIDAFSEGLGRGSEFVIRLPIAEHAPAAEHVAHAAEPETKASALRVVIIDDNVDAAHAMASLVEALGGTAYVAHDGPSGIERVQAVKPDVVLLDIRMPGLDGYETCRRIRANLGTAVSIIAVTGYGQNEDKERALAAGFDAHLTKPADPKLLRAYLHL
jgi:CheY-like chemotaxis protein